MADALILHNNKPNTFQFTVVAEGIVLSEATIKLCVQIADKITVSFKCTPGLDNTFVCEITDASIIKDGNYKCWLEVVTTNGFIFKPLSTDITVKKADEKEAKVTADVKTTKKVEDKKEDKKEEKEDKKAEKEDKKEEKEDKKDESVNDQKVRAVLQGLGLTSPKKTVNENRVDRSKIPSLKSKIKH